MESKIDRRSMSTVNVTEELNKENVINDLEDDKLAALRAKKAKQDMASKIVAKKEVSLEIGVIGTGAAGGRLAEVFGELGYEVVACNTANQDLKNLFKIPESNKLLLDYGLGGAAKDLEIGKAAVEAHANEIKELIANKLSNSQALVLCTSLGGGSGAGSCEPLIDILAEEGKPIIVIACLPMDSEDSLTKINSLTTLATLSKFTQTKKINNLIVVDNSKIESIFSGVSQMNFFDAANKAIVNTLDAFNTLSVKPSHVSLDSMEWVKMLIDGEGLSVYGEFTVDNYEEDTAIAEAIVENLQSNMLSSNNLKESRYVGFMLVANEETWSKIPAASVNYASSMINDFCESPKGVFKGLYTDPNQKSGVRVLSFFSGLGLPAARVDQLKEETKGLQAKSKEKDDKRNLTLQLDSGNDVVSDAQKIRDKISASKSSFGKLLNKVTDRRK